MTTSYAATVSVENTQPQPNRAHSGQLDAALAYAKRGWAVFPCKTGKAPLTAHGHHDASTDPDQIKSWWTEHPTASIGCPAGAGMGAWVLDIDLPDGPNSLAALGAKHGSLPTTLEQKTGGGGRHLFFRWQEGRPVRNNAGKLDTGLDVRGEGGYVILPPSNHPSGKTYAWVNEDVPIAEAPEWLMDLVSPVAPCPQQGQAPCESADTAQTNETSAYGRKALEAEVAKVATAAEGARNDTLFKASCSLGQLVAGGELNRSATEAELAGAALATGLAEPEIRRTIASGLATGAKEPRTAPRASVAMAPARTTKALSMSDQFSLREDGVYIMEPDKDGNPEFHWVCSPLRILARTRNADGQAWGHLLEVVDPEGNSHRWAMPTSFMAGSGNDYRSELMSNGLTIAPGSKGKQRLELYLSTAKTERFARCVERIGWHGDVFVLPDAVIGDQCQEEVVLQGMPGENPFHQLSTLDDWQERLGRLCVGNSRLVLAVSAALAAPLIEPLGAESGGLHFFGSSSVGKTTALRVAGSVCGGGNGPNGFIKQWRTTDNGLEGIAAAHCDALLCMDELGQANSKVASESAYMLANGQGKGRASRDGQARKAKTWRTIFLSTGEVTLADKLAEDGRSKAKAGQTVRVVDIPADAGTGGGLFEVLHGAESAERFARQLSVASKACYGTVFRAFLEALTKDRDELVQQAREIVKGFVGGYCPVGADGQVQRVCERFGLIAAAGEIATTLGLLPWPIGETTKAAATCFQAWIDQRGGTGSGEIAAGIEQVRRFFQAHGASRFEELDTTETRIVSNRAGYSRFNSDEDLFLVFTEAFQREVCAGFNHKTIAKELIRLGHLKADPGRLTKKLRTPKGTFFAVRASILSADTGDSADLPVSPGSKVSPALSVTTRSEDAVLPASPAPEPVLSGGQDQPTWGQQEPLSLLASPAPSASVAF